MPLSDSDAVSGQTPHNDLKAAERLGRGRVIRMRPSDPDAAEQLGHHLATQTQTQQRDSKAAERLGRHQVTRISPARTTRNWLGRHRAFLTTQKDSPATLATRTTHN